MDRTLRLFEDHFPFSFLTMQQDFTLFAIVQDGRLAFEAVLLAASLARSNPAQQMLLLEPRPGRSWPEDPRINPDVRALLEHLGAKIIPFENQLFGASYPNGNKIEALQFLPPHKPFLFLDTDTLVHGSLADVPFDFSRPTASMRREGTWPKGEHIDNVWRALYERFDLDFHKSLDEDFPVNDWQRYLYFNAGFFFGEDPRAFGETFATIAGEIWRDPGKALDGQKLTPWLDQIALPLTIHALGGGRGTLPPGLMDRHVTCHYRKLPLLYAREAPEIVDFLEEIAAPNKIKKVLKQYEPAKRIIYQGVGREIRAMFDKDELLTEQDIRQRIKAAGLWLV